MDLNTIWFALIGILYIGFFVLEGFDFGVGMLLPFLGKKDVERRAIINTVGPHWDGNEVWLLTAGGATFAAFPHWYATMFSGFYLALFLLLVGLILRGVAFEFRSKEDNKGWRKRWDRVIFVGSLIPALLLGVAFANLARGLPISSDMIYSEGLFYLLNPYSVVGGLLSIAAFLLHGAHFLSLKTTDAVRERAEKLSGKLWVATAVIFILFTLYSTIETDFFSGMSIWHWVAGIGAALSLLVAGLFGRQKRFGMAFLGSTFGIVFTLAAFFLNSYPRVMISTLNPDWSLTVYNASSSDYTLGVMTIVAITAVPIVLAYQIWTYRVFRKRISADPEQLVY